MKDTQKPETDPTNRKNRVLGHFLNGFSIFLSVASSLWQAWLLPIVDSLSSQGRMNEGDADGYFYGLLMGPTYFVVPVVAIIALVLGIFGFRLRSRTLAIIAWIAVILSLIQMRSAWFGFFSS
ncbi:MAG: hypothetical protein HON98_09790 [Chloroflexi bacterium]|nr:hypothetical protein [Chloroflexota bacterium]MBT3669016.1 hypothetical protein [Chloroflexota bacterium]MBT4003617.1 hypothetical protein [Chloroflexota bacterium]MBT4304987.1 hypothetical protein [Chloroflexota bacterium]MBT4533250.1 hypothetical protein [Chloroflexota bacterium]